MRLANQDKLIMKQAEENDYHVVCSCGKPFDGSSKKVVVDAITTHWKELHGVAKIEDAAFAAIFNRGHQAVVDNIYINKDGLTRVDFPIKAQPHDEEDGDEDVAVSVR